MLPPLYAEEDDGYGPVPYATTDDRGRERYAVGFGPGAVDVYGYAVTVQGYGDSGGYGYRGGPVVNGGYRYGGDAVLAGNYDDGGDDQYWTLLDADGPLNYPDGASWDRNLPSDYAFQSLYGHTEFGSDWEYT